jgi:hypothetical protein
MSNLWSEIGDSYDINEEINLLEALQINEIAIYGGHGRYSEGPDFNVTQDMLDNLTSIFSMDFDHVNEFNEESESGIERKNSYGKREYEKRNSRVERNTNLDKKNKEGGKLHNAKWSQSKVRAGDEVELTVDAGKDMANGTEVSFEIKEQDKSTESTYESVKTCGVGQGVNLTEKGKEYVKSVNTNGRSYIQQIYGEEKELISKSQSWAKNIYGQGKSLIINDTRRSDSTSSNTDGTTNSIIRSDLNQNIASRNMNSTSRANYSNYKINSQLNTKSKLKKGPQLFIARSYHRDGYDQDPYVNCLIGDDDNENGSHETKYYTHLQQYNDLGQLESEDFFGHETGGTDYAWWGTCNGWSSAAIMEPEPQDPVGGRNNTEFYKWSTTNVARLDPEVYGQLTRAGCDNKTELEAVTGGEIGYIQTVESTSNPELSVDGNDIGNSYTTKSTEFYQNANIKPGFYVPDLQISSDRIDDPTQKDEIVENGNGSDDPKSILKSVSMNTVQTVEGNQVDDNSTNKLGVAGELTLLEPINQSNETDEDLPYVFILRSLYEPNKPLFDPVKAGVNTNRITGLLEKPILKLKGTVEGELDESFGIDLEGSIKVEEDFTKKFGEKVKATLKEGGHLGVKVTKNKFQYAELSGLKVDAKVTIGDKELKLQGEISGGKYNNDYSLDFYGSIKLKKDFSKQFGEKVRVTLKSGGKLSVKVNKSEFQYAELGPTCQMNISIGDQALKLKGTIDGKIDEDFKVDLDGEIKVKENFTYKKKNVTSLLASGASLGAKVTANKFKSADLNLTCDVNITIPSINESKLKLNGAIDGKYKSGRIDFTSKLSTEDEFSYGREKVIADLRSGGVVRPKVESSKFKSALFGGININVDVAMGETNPDDNNSLKLKGAVDGAYYVGELKISTVLGALFDSLKTSWGDDPIPTWGTNTRVDSYGTWISGFIGGVGEDSPPSEDPEPGNDNNTDPNDGNNTDPNNGNNSGREYYNDATSLSTNIKRFVDNYNSLRKYSQSNINESMTISNQLNFNMFDEDSLLFSLGLQSYYKTQLKQPYKWWLPKTINPRKTKWASYSGWSTAVDISGGDEFEIDMDADLTSRYIVDQFGLINDDLGTYYPDNDTLYPRMTKGELISKINSKGDITLSKKSVTGNDSSDDDMTKEDLINSINFSLEANHTKIANFTDYYRDNTRGDNVSRTSRYDTEVGEYGLVMGYTQETEDDTASSDLIVMTNSNMGITGTGAFDTAQSYWTYWQWFDQIISSWSWDDEISTDGNPYSEKDVRLGFDEGKQKLSAGSGAPLGSGAFGKVEVEVDVSKIGDMAANTGKASVDSDSDGKLELSDPEGNETKTIIWKSSVSSGITAEDDWEAPNAVVDSFFDITLSTDNSSETNSSDRIDPNIALDLLNVVSIDLGDIAVGMDRENSIECIMDTRLIVDDLFPSGPAKIHWSSIVNFDAWDYKNDPNRLFPSGPAKGFNFDCISQLALGSGITAEDDWEAPNAILSTITVDLGDIAVGMDRENSIECIMDTRLFTNDLFPSGPAKGALYDGTRNSVSASTTSQTNESGIDPNIAFDMLNIVSVDIGDIAVGMDRENSIECSCYEYIEIFDDDTSPSGPSKGATIDSDLRIDIDSTGQVSGIGESPFHEGWFIDISSGIIFAPGSNVSGVEPSPFHFDSTFSMSCTTRESEPGGWVRDNRDYDSYFDDLDDFGGNSGSGVYLSSEIHNTFNTNISEIINTTGDDYGVGQSPFHVGSSLNFATNIVYNSATSLLIGEKIMLQHPAFYFPAGGGVGSNFNVEVDVSQIVDIGPVNERINTSDIDDDGKLDTRNNSSWNHVYFSFSSGIQFSNIDGVIDGGNSSPGDYLTAHDGFSMESYFSSNLKLGNLLPNKFGNGTGNDSDDNTMVVAGFDIYHRLTRGTNARTWGDGFSSTSRVTCTFHDPSTAVGDSNYTVPDPYLSYESGLSVEFGEGVGGVSGDSENDPNNNNSDVTRSNSTKIQPNFLLSYYSAMNYFFQPTMVDNSNEGDNNSNYDHNEWASIDTNFELSYGSSSNSGTGGSRGSSDNENDSDVPVMFNVEKVSFKKHVEWEEERDFGNRPWTYDGVILSSESRFEFSRNDDNNKIIIRSYDRLHRLSRGRNSRTWGDRDNGSDNDSALTFSIVNRLESSFSIRNLFNDSDDDGLSPGGTTGDVEYSTNTDQQNTRGDTSLSRNRTTPKSASITIKSESQINVMFNPSKLQFDKTVPWTEQVDVGFSVPVGQFPETGRYSIMVILKEYNSDNNTNLDKWTKIDRMYTSYYDDSSFNISSEFKGQMGNYSSEFHFVSNTNLVFEGVTNQMTLMQTFSYSGMEMNKNNTTIAGNQYSSNTLIAVDNGTVSLKTVSNFSSFLNILGGSGGNFNIDSFFDVTYEITTDRENESTTITAGVQEVDFDIKISVFGDDEVVPIDFCWNVSSSIKMSSISSSSGSQIIVNSFFDITYEIPSEHDNSDIIAGIEWCTQLSGAQVINMALGGAAWPGSEKNIRTEIISHFCFNNSKEVHPDFYWMGSTIIGWNESEDDLNNDSDTRPITNYSKFRIVHVMKMNFTYIIGDDDNDSEIEMHADFMTKAELIGTVPTGDINDSKEDQSQSSRSGETNGSRPPQIKHEIYMNYHMNFMINNTSNNKYELWSAGEFITNIIANWDDKNRGAHDNDSSNYSNRIIISAWRDFDSNRSYKFGINVNNKYLCDENNSNTYSIISKWSSIGPSNSFKIDLRYTTGDGNNDDNSDANYNFKLEIKGVNAGQFTANDNLSIEQEIIDYGDENTFWCRVSSSMTLYGSGNNSIPEVDDEVDISIGQKYVPSDDSDLLYYSYNLLAENLTPGEDPDYLFNTIYRYTGNDSYYGEVSYYNETYNNGAGNGTNITIKIDTYKKSVDENGNVVRELLFTDVIKIKYATINVSAKDSSMLRETMTIRVERTEQQR